MAPDSADVEKLMGWAYYGANKTDQAIDAWKRAEQLHPDPEVENALAKARRDKAEEESYREGETAHFDLKYYGGANPDLARDILRTLEDDFQRPRIAARLHAARPDRRHPIYAAGVRRYHPRAGMGGSAQRRPPPHSRAGIDGSDARTRARAQA